MRLTATPLTAGDGFALRIGRDGALRVVDSNFSGMRDLSASGGRFGFSGYAWPCRMAYRSLVSISTRRQFIFAIETFRVAKYDNAIVFREI